MNVLLAYGPAGSRYAVLVVLGATCVLWSTRVVLQIVWPQGSASAILQDGMLLLFAGVLACYLLTLILVLLERNVE